MKLLVLALLVLIGAVALGLGVLEDPGYVRIGFGAWSLETTAAFLGFVLLLTFVVFYFAIRLLARLRRLPRDTRGRLERRRARKARDALNEGLIMLSEGRWDDAEKRLLKHVEHSDNPLLNYLAASRAAQQQGVHERRDQYLRLAHKNMPQADVAVGLTQAELQIAHRQMEQALATLTHLRTIAPRHGYVLKMLANLYYTLRDWNPLYELLPDLRRRGVFGEEELERLECRVNSELMAQAAEHEDLDRLRHLWNRLPKRLAQEPMLQLAYARHLQQLGAPDEADGVVRSALKRRWDPELVYFYGQFQAGDAGRQLAAAEGWLGEHGKDPVLLLTLGRLAIRTRLWGKARSYLEASIGLSPTVESYQVLGSLLEQMGEPEEAMECYRAGMLLAADAAALPAPGNGDSPPALTAGDRIIAQPASESS